MNARESSTVAADPVRETVVNIGRRIAGARAYRNLSQADVATAAETTPARVSQIENASASPRLDTIVRVARAVGLEVTLRESAA